MDMQEEAKGSDSSMVREVSRTGTETRTGENGAELQQQPVEEKAGGQEPQGEESAEQSPETQVNDDNVPFHKHPRFKELMSELQLSRKEIAELKKQTAPKEEVPNFEDMFLGMGFGEDAAKRMVEVLEKFVGHKTKKYDNYENTLVDIQRERALAIFQTEHKDYKQVEPIMVEIFESLSPEVREAFKRDTTDKSLNILYELAKKQTNADFKKGQAAAVKNADLKKQGGSMRGTPSEKKTLTMQDIAKMSTKEYQERLPEIQELINTGQLR